MSTAFKAHAKRGASEGGKVSATYRDAGAGAHRSRALVKTIGAACAPRTSSPEAIKAQASLVSETSKSHKGIERSVRGVPRRTWRAAEVVVELRPSAGDAWLVLDRQPS